jgi:hypothetical protein
VHTSSPFDAAELPLGDVGCEMRAEPTQRPLGSHLLCNTLFFQLVISDFGLTLVHAPNQFRNVMSRKTSAIRQSNITRAVKGAVAGGLRIASVRVDKDGSIVLLSEPEREEREEPRLSIDSNEWDEVLRK